MFVLIAGIVVFIGIKFLSNGNYYRIIFAGKNEFIRLHEFYITYFSYYLLLAPKEKQKFLKRIINIRHRKELKINKAIQNDPEEVELLVCAAFAQITFGFDDYEIDG